MALLKMYAVRYQDSEDLPRIALFESEDAQNEFISGHDGECEVAGKMGVMYAKGLVERKQQEREERLSTE